MAPLVLYRGAGVVVCYIIVSVTAKRRPASLGPPEPSG